MRSLQEVSLLKLAEDAENLRDLINLCDQNPSLKNACMRTPTFFKEKLTEFFGDEIISQRGDLNDNDWYDFAVAMHSGIIFAYATMPEQIGGVNDIQPALPFYSVATKWTVDDFAKFDLIGLPPPKGAVGVLAILDETELRTGGYALDISEVFIAKDHATAMQNAQIFAAREYVTHVSKRAYKYSNRDVEYQINDLDLEYEGPPPTEDMIFLNLRSVANNETVNYDTLIMGTYWDYQRNRQWESAVLIQFVLLRFE